MTRWDPVEQVNRENERRMSRPPVVLFLITAIGTPLFIVVLIYFGEFINSFTTNHPLIVGYSCVVVGVSGSILLARKMW